MTNGDEEFTLVRMLRRDVLQFFLALAGAVFLPIAISVAFPQMTGVPRLLSVGEGMWQSKLPGLEKRAFSELKAPVDIAFDEQGIPHIIAQNDDDLFFAQGLLTAHFRLFEMDISTRVAAGRLSELAGSRAIDYDRFFVTFGMRQAIKAQTAILLADPANRSKITAYMKGVNTYIRQLRYRDLPLEYKLLNAWPEEWDESRLAALLKIMTFRLSGRSRDLSLTRLLQTLGREKTESLFPEFLPANLEAYFVERNGNAKRDRDSKLETQIHIKEFPPMLNIFEANGSNSWAVAPSKSKTGRSILANDTHLAYQLPSVWFETQLLSPTTNVYGATFPGTPGIILGMNSKIAWGATNATADSIDWSEFEFKDETSNDYRFDPGFKPPTIFNEEIKIRYSEPLHVQVMKTDYGYVLHREKQYGLAARWTGHESSNELKTFVDLWKAQSLSQCLEALKSWKSPAQNFTCADENNVAVYYTGRIPIRNGDQGWVVKRTTGQESLWQGEIPFEELPHSVNPSIGFVFSANERPVGPSYPYYLNWDFEEPFRGQRIRNLLTEKPKMDGSDFIQIQNDFFDQHASLAMPILTKLVQTPALNDQEKLIFQTMTQWDYLARGNAIESSVFSIWWNNVEKLLWNESKLSDRPLIPKKARTIWFFRQLGSDPVKWSEWLKPFANAEELVTKAFQNAVKELDDVYGMDTQAWNWDNVQKTKLPHVAKIPGLDSDRIEMDGAAYSIMSNRGAHGPTWKFVVELGSSPRAWAQFPGGVTGNPLDPNYEKFVRPWARGEMRPVQFWRSESEAMSNAAYVWRWETY